MLKSLENEEFLVYFQPKVDLQTGLATQAGSAGTLADR